MGILKSRKVKKEKPKETFYDEISHTTRSLVVWLDDLLRKPEDLFKMHEHHIHLMEMRAITATPFHKDKKIDSWIKNKIHTVVSTYRYYEDIEDFKYGLRRSQR